MLFMFIRLLIFVNQGWPVICSFSVSACDSLYVPRVKCSLPASGFSAAQNHLIWAITTAAAAADMNFYKCTLILPQS